MKPIVTEKAVMKIELENLLTFIVDKKMNKSEIKKDIEQVFNVRIDKIRTSIKNNKKYAYVKLNKRNLAIDIATKLGII